MNSPYVIDSIDGGNLTNLGAVNIRLITEDSLGTNIAGAMRLRPGTYGGLRWDTGTSSNRDNWLKLTGNTSFTGRAVIPGNMSGSLDPVASNDSLFIQPGSAGSFSVKNVSLEGFNLTLTHNLTVDDQSNSVTTSNFRGTLIAASNSGSGQTLTVGGDISITSAFQGSDARGLETTLGSGVARGASRLFGIDGGASGNFIVRVGGNFTTNVMSNTRAAFTSNLSASTLFMLGGTDGNPVTWEVGDAAADSGVGVNKFSVGTFNVGDTGDPAVVKLVNTYINNNPLALLQDPNVNKAGEKLIAGTLNIRANSLLDANLGIASAEVATALFIDPTGTLDLNTGTVLTLGYIVPNFIGLGDQTSVWNTFANRVLDSGNVGTTFEAILDTGNTKWQVVAIPEPTTIVLIALGAAGLLIARRRRS